MLVTVVFILPLFDLILWQITRRMGRRGTAISFLNVEQKTDNVAFFPNPKFWGRVGEEKGGETESGRDPSCIHVGMAFFPP